MKHDEFINLSKKMVVEYHNRYIHTTTNRYNSIDLEDVMIIEMSDNRDGIWHIIMRVDIDPWMDYVVEYNPNIKGKNKKKIHSYIIYV